MAKLKLSGVAVLLIIVVPLFMYMGALLIGIQLGRSLERRPDSDTVSFSIRGALAYVAEELWDTNNVLGLRRRRGKHERVEQEWQPVPVSLHIVGHESPALESKPPNDDEDQDSSATPKSHRYHTNHTWMQLIRGVISIGSWGGSGGQPFSMRGPRAPRLRTIVLYHSTAIHSLACGYSVAGDDGDNRMAGPWGLPHSFGSKGVRATINLSAGEHVTAVEGTTGHFVRVSDVVVTSLTFRTNTGRTYGPYGNTAGTPFSVPAADGACIVGFWGRSGWLLDAIGVYVRPCSSSNKAGGYNHRPYAMAMAPPTPEIQDGENPKGQIGDDPIVDQVRSSPHV